MEKKEKESEGCTGGAPCNTNKQTECCKEKEKKKGPRVTPCVAPTGNPEEEPSCQTDSLIERERLENKAKRRNIVHPKNKCFKCLAPPAIAYRNGLVCCKECFKSAVVETHFRSVIRGFLNPKPREIAKFLILLSGGPGSVALSFMAAETIHGKTQSKRKMFVEAEMLHVDESVFYPWHGTVRPEILITEDKAPIADNEMADKPVETSSNHPEPDQKQPTYESLTQNEENLLRLKKLSKDIGLKLHIVSLAKKYKLTQDSAKDMLEAASDRGSCKEDIIVYLRNAAVEDFARKNGFGNLVVGDTGLRVASNTICSIIKGKGVWFEALARESGEFFPGTNDLRICRPLKEFLPKEIFFYLHSQGLTNYVQSRLNISTQAPAKVQALPGAGNYTRIIDHFLDTLQKEFPSTIFTVLTTTEKVKVDVDLQKKNEAALELELAKLKPLAQVPQTEGQLPTPVPTPTPAPTSAPSAHLYPPRPLCPICRGPQDDFNALEFGFDRPLINPEDKTALSMANLDKQLQASMDPFSKSLCFSCAKMISWANDPEVFKRVFVKE